MHSLDSHLCWNSEDSTCNGFCDWNFCLPWRDPTLMVSVTVSVISMYANDVEEKTRESLKNSELPFSLLTMLYTDAYDILKAKNLLCQEWCWME